MEPWTTTPLLEAVRTAVGGALTEEGIWLISNRKAQLQRFRQLLNDPEFFERERGLVAGPEAVWQGFFEENPWIFGYGLTLIACGPFDDGKLERITTGANIFSGVGKRSDAVMRSKGFISSLHPGRRSHHVRRALPTGLLHRGGPLRHICP